MKYESLEMQTMYSQIKWTNVIEKRMVVTNSKCASWEKRIDPDGKPYYVDTKNNEMYRVETSILGSSSHKRIHTDEKMTIAIRESESVAKEAKDRFDKENEKSPESNEPEKKQDNATTMKNLDLSEDSNDEDEDKDEDEEEKLHEFAPVAWACPACTYENTIDLNLCDACQQPKPADAKIIYPAKTTTRTSQNMSNLDDDVCFVSFHFILEAIFFFFCLHFLLFTCVNICIIVLYIHVCILYIKVYMTGFFFFFCKDH
ncbi:hypothetical protein RFI_12586 [Reticulomyxa filosa]|uniref:RanBP2-type domain-containing protein n=1 Tax=Reticulomyxa filosa TaxID=46433 RepID=X6NFP8_RETFI|nr:hypothetical protein RFI_12586 [Reticulomyxa filosa]|eukprot:ETO24574.1 hypothetical protein RFI_12586 [Reticulomyxa filosa]